MIAHEGAHQVSPLRKKSELVAGDYLVEHWSQYRLAMRIAPLYATACTHANTHLTSPAQAGLFVV